MNTVIKHAKEIPAPGKYNDALIVNWCKPQMEVKFKVPVSCSHELFKGKFSGAEKVTLFSAMGKAGRKLPGPWTYNDDKAKDIAVLRRNTAAYKSSNPKYTYMESELHFRKKDPGPNKYTPKQELVRPRTAFYAKMSTAIGREDKKQKKDKTPGPTTYRWDQAQSASSTSIRGPINVLISGMGLAAGSKGAMKHTEKLKVKSSRCFDMI